MTRRKFNLNIKSLLHFDYPYYGELNAGCRDEINGTIFVKHGDARFANSGQQRISTIIAGTPKFGYCCLRTHGNTDYLSAPNDRTQFNVSSGLNYEFECFVMIVETGQGNIVTLINDETAVLSVALNSESKVVFSSSDLSLNISTSAALTSSVWYHIRARLVSGQAYIFVNGTQSASGTYDVTKSLTVSELRIGGFKGCIDEFVMRDAAEATSSVPSGPYQAVLDINQLGGFGDSRTSTTITQSNYIMNSYAAITSCSGKKLTVKYGTTGKLSSFSQDTEIMIHVTAKKTNEEEMLGYFAFRKIAGVSGNTITLDKAVSDEFNLSAAVNAYYVQAITVPNLQTLTINKNCNVTAPEYSATKGGGIIAVRVSGNITLNGGIITSGKGPSRTDSFQLTHSDMPDRFLTGKGGGIFIACGGKFTGSSTGRIGATWPGVCRTIVSGVPAHGGAGYGGAHPATPYYCVGYGHYNGYVKPGFEKTSAAGKVTRSSGANLILVAKTLSVHEDVISTGGEAANSTSGTLISGGGTGFAYIACEEMI